MGKESFKKMPDPNIASVFEVDSSIPGEKTEIVDYSLNFERVINDVARRYCEPDEEIYKNSSELVREPLKAAEHVHISGYEKSWMTADPEKKVIAQIAKLQSAQENLKLTSKQNEHFEGVKENQKGALGFIGAMVGAIEDPVIRRKVFVAGIAAVQSLGLAACMVNNPVIISTEITPNISPTVEVTQATDVPGTIIIKQDPTTSPTETQQPVATGIGYPSGPENFILNAGGSEEADRQIIIDQGAGEDLKALEELLKKELRREGKDPANYKLLPVTKNDGITFNWDVVVVDPQGHILEATITSGKEAGLTVRNIGVVNYLYLFGDNEDFFDFSYTSRPKGYEDAIEQIVYDKSGWKVKGLFSKEGTFVGWFNADKGETGEWQILPEPAVSPTPTEKAEAQDIWQVSPDGHIVYNEAQLYGGMFTIDKEHPEYTEKYWEDTIRGLWNLNSVGENTAFLSQFPTDDSLVDYLQKGGEPVSNLWIPVIYPSSNRRYINQATLVPTENSVDLTKISIAIYKPSQDEMYKFNSNYASGTKYVSYLGAAGEAMVEEVNFEGKYILCMTLRRDLLMDATRLLPIDEYGYEGKNGTMLAIMGEKTDEENLLAATQLLRSWPLHMQIKDTAYAIAWMKNSIPPRINFNSIGPVFLDYEEITTLDETPLAIRK